MKKFIFRFSFVADSNDNSDIEGNPQSFTGNPLYDFNPNANDHNFPFHNHYAVPPMIPPPMIPPPQYFYDWYDPQNNPYWAYYYQGFDPNCFGYAPPSHSRSQTPQPSMSQSMPVGNPSPYPYYPYPVPPFMWYPPYMGFRPISASRETTPCFSETEKLSKMSMSDDRNRRAVSCTPTCCQHAKPVAVEENRNKFHTFEEPNLKVHAAAMSHNLIIPVKSDIESTDDEREEFPLNCDRSLRRSLKSIPSVSNINVYEEENGEVALEELKAKPVVFEEEDEAESEDETTEVEDEISQDTTTADLHFPHQLSVIYEENESTNNERRSSIISRSSTLSDCSTTLMEEDNISDVDYSGDEMEDENSNSVTVRLPLTFSFTRSKDNLVNTTMTVGETEREVSESHTSKSSEAAPLTPPVALTNGHKSPAADVSVTFRLKSKSKTPERLIMPKLSVKSASFDSDPECSVSISLPRKTKTLPKAPENVEEKSDSSSDNKKNIDTSLFTSLDAFEEIKRGMAEITNSLCSKLCTLRKSTLNIPSNDPYRSSSTSQIESIETDSDNDLSLSYNDFKMDNQSNHLKLPEKEENDLSYTTQGTEYVDIDTRMEDSRLDDSKFEDSRNEDFSKNENLESCDKNDDDVDFWSQISSANKNYEDPPMLSKTSTRSSRYWFEDDAEEEINDVNIVQEVKDKDHDVKVSENTEVTSNQKAVNNNQDDFDFWRNYDAAATHAITEDSVKVSEDKCSNDEPNEIKEDKLEEKYEAEDIEESDDIVEYESDHEEIIQPIKEEKVKAEETSHTNVLEINIVDRNENDDELASDEEWTEEEVEVTDEDYDEEQDNKKTPDWATLLKCDTKALIAKRNQKNLEESNEVEQEDESEYEDESEQEVEEEIEEVEEKVEKVEEEIEKFKEKVEEVKALGKNNLSYQSFENFVQTTCKILPSEKESQATIINNKITENLSELQATYKLNGVLNHNDIINSNHKNLSQSEEEDEESSDEEVAPECSKSSSSKIVKGKSLVNVNSFVVSENSREKLSAAIQKIKEIDDSDESEYSSAEEPEFEALPEISSNHSLKHSNDDCQLLTPTQTYDQVLPRTLTAIQSIESKSNLTSESGISFEHNEVDSEDGYEEDSEEEAPPEDEKTVTKESINLSHDVESDQEEEVKVNVKGKISMFERAISEEPQERKEIPRVPPKYSFKHRETSEPPLQKAAVTSQSVAPQRAVTEVKEIAMNRKLLDLIKQRKSIPITTEKEEEVQRKSVKERISSIEIESDANEKRENYKRFGKSIPLVRSIDESGEEDSGVTSDFCKQLSEAETDSENFPELRKLSRYQRASTHSRLFKLLQGDDDETEGNEPEVKEAPKPEPTPAPIPYKSKKIIHNVSVTRRQNPKAALEAETMEERRQRLCLPLSHQSSSGADSMSSSTTPSPTPGVVNEKLVNELVQSLLSQKKGRIFKNLPIEKLHAAAVKILQEDLESNGTLSSADESTIPTVDSTPALTPQEFRNNSSYAEYYESWDNNNTQAAEDDLSDLNLIQSKAFKNLQDQQVNVSKKLWSVRCPRILSSKSINKDLARLSEVRESESPEPNQSRSPSIRSLSTEPMSGERSNQQERQKAKTCNT